MCPSQCHFYTGVFAVHICMLGTCFVVRFVESIQLRLIILLICRLSSWESKEVTQEGSHGNSSGWWGTMLRST